MSSFVYSCASQATHPTNQPPTAGAVGGGGSRRARHTPREIKYMRAGHVRFNPTTRRDGSGRRHCTRKCRAPRATRKTGTASSHLAASWWWRFFLDYHFLKWPSLKSWHSPPQQRQQLVCTRRTGPSRGAAVVALLVRERGCHSVLHDWLCLLGGKGVKRPPSGLYCGPASRREESFTRRAGGQEGGERRLLIVNNT